MQIFLAPISILKEPNNNLLAPRHLAFYCSNDVNLLNVFTKFLQKFIKNVKQFKHLVEKL